MERRFRRKPVVVVAERSTDTDKAPGPWTVRLEGNGRQWEMTDKDFQEEFEPIEAEYPDARRRERQLIGDGIV